MYQSSFLVGLVLLASFYFCDINCQRLGAGDAREVIPKNEDDDDVENRITRGLDTYLHEFPWAVRVRYILYIRNGPVLNRLYVTCGGTLLNARRVLTAATCLKHVSGIGAYIAFIGDYDTRTFPVDCINTTSGQTCNENKRLTTITDIVHPEFDVNTLENNIGILLLEEPVNFTEFIQPICLPPFNIEAPEYLNKSVSVVGWGSDGTRISPVKKWTELGLLAREECLKYYPQMPRTQFCAIGLRPDEDVCYGDDGGPLSLYVKGEHVLFGVISEKFDNDTCNNKKPSLFVNVYHYVKWIRTFLQNEI